MRLSKELRRYFDELVDEAIAELPADVQELLEEVPLHVEDAPSTRLLEEMGIESPEELFGFYTRTPVPMILLFRYGLFTLATDESGQIDEDELFEQIITTILHEIAHHRGMTEGEVDELGYG